MFTRVIRLVFIGWIASMASGESSPSRLLMKARIGEAGWLRKPLRAACTAGSSPAHNKTSEPC